MSDSAKTVRVRIAVAVDPSGMWCASGWMDYATQAPVGGEAMDVCVDAVAQGAARYWIEADAPLPLEPQTIEGEVTT